MGYHRLREVIVTHTTNTSTSSLALSTYCSTRNLWVEETGRNCNREIYRPHPHRWICCHFTSLNMRSEIGIISLITCIGKSYEIIVWGSRNLTLCDVWRLCNSITSTSCAKFDLWVVWFTIDEAVRQGKTHETYYTKALWYEIICGGKRSPGGWSSMEVAPSPYLIGVVWEWDWA